MARTREIRKRIKAVGTIARITKTMQMIATAKFTAAMQRATATKPFSKTIRRLVGELAAAAGDIQHPLLNGPPAPTGRELLLYISSDRGLCGAYNSNVYRLAHKFVREKMAAGVQLDFDVSGKKGINFFKFAKFPLRQKQTIGDKPTYEMIEKIAEEYIVRFTEGMYDAVHVASMRFESASRQVPQVMQLLPFRTEPSPTDEKAAAVSYEFSPSGEALLADLLPLAVKAMLFQAVTDAVVSEQLMRMVAMKAATENAKQLGRTLNRRYNRARQTQITTELTEIVSGAAALE